MTDKELNKNIRVFAAINEVPIERVKVISKSELVVGAVYQGECRNSDTAMWDGNKFVYKRHKFGCSYNERINHFEDDDGYDVFVPMKIIEQK